jgi:membrane protease YdiL (CAAX protease family)
MLLKWIEIVIVAACCAVGARHYIHMLQLESYQLPGYKRYLNRNFERIMRSTVLIGVIFIMASSFALLPLNQMFPQDVDVYGKGVFTLLTIVVIAPILEELIFRGRLYNLFGKNISPLASALCTSLIFGVVHFEPVVILGAALIGFMLSCLYLYKRSIITPIILHMCNNALAYALNMLSYADKSLTDYISTEGYVVVVIYGLCCIITIVSLVFMIRYFRKEARLQTDKKEDSNQIDEVIYE